MPAIYFDDNKIICKRADAAHFFKMGGEKDIKNKVKYKQAKELVPIYWKKGKRYIETLADPAGMKEFIKKGAVQKLPENVMFTTNEFDEKIIEIVPLEKDKETKE